jgi:putative radical SAM enzyme (TIGR03279 family)
MNGNYVTLSNAEPDELERMGEMGLSPLFISVHATNTAVRNRLLGNRQAPDILDQLEFGIDCGVSFHTQIVVCPGINNGRVLEQSIRELLGLGENILSIAVVPVGLTRHRKSPLKPVDSSSASEIIELVDRLGDIDKNKMGRRRVFSADELYLRANLAIPPSRYYEDFPQIENGVGLLRTARMEWERLRRRRGNSLHGSGAGEKRRVLLLTGVSAGGFFRRLSASIQKKRPNLEISVHAVVNRFFGETVTVGGLLTASDMIHASKQHGKPFDLMVIPGEALNYRGVTLDGYSIERMNRIVGERVVAPRSIEEMLQYLCE